MKGGRKTGNENEERSGEITNQQGGKVEWRGEQLYQEDVLRRERGGPGEPNDEPKKPNEEGKPEPRTRFRRSTT